MSSPDDIMSGAADDFSDGIRVNMSKEEADSQDREPLPIGKFHLKITAFEIRFVSDEPNANTGSVSKHAGKPYINFEFTVQDGNYAGRRDWTNAMCFEPALYTISQILKALDYPVPRGGGKLIIPDKAGFYLGKDLWGRRDYDRSKNAQRDPNTGKTRIQLQGFSKYEGGTSTAGPAEGKVTAKATAGSSVLP